MIGGIVKRLNTFLPSATVWHAQGDVPAPRETFLRDVEEALRIVLMFEYFEKGDDVKRFIRIGRMKFFRTQSKYLAKTVRFACKRTAL